MRTVPILFTFDESLILPAGVCITSLLENADIDTFYDIYILHSERYDFSSSRLTELTGRYPHRCDIHFMKVSNEFKGAYEVRGIPETAYYRLISPELIPEYDKIIYSDVDVIFREDLAKYYEIDLGDNYFAGVDNYLCRKEKENSYVTTVLGLDSRNGYYYSGNLIINLKQIREDHLTDRFRELGKNDYLYQDMDIINIACNGRILELGPVFCLAVQLYEFIVNRREEMESVYGKKALDDALDHGIVHYNGTKPWNGACTNMDIWWKYYRKSLFFDEQFCYDFWNNQLNLLSRLSLQKRIKLLLRYPLDKKHR